MRTLRNWLWLVTLLLASCVSGGKAGEGGNLPPPPEVERTPPLSQRVRYGAISEEDVARGVGLYVAILQGHASQAVEMLREGAPVNVPVALDLPIHAAMRWCQPSVVDELLKRGADPAQHNAIGETILHAAAWGGDVRCVRKALALGIGVDALDDMLATPLARAIERHNHDVVRLLLERGASVRRLIRFLSPVQSPVAWLMEHADTTDLALLLPRVGLWVRDIWGLVALYRASGVPVEKTRMLLEQGAPVRQKCPGSLLECMSPLYHLACSSGPGDLYRVAHLLITHGAEPDAYWRDDGWTALHRAAAELRPGVVKALLEGGADPSAPTLWEGGLPMDMVLEHEAEPPPGDIPNRRGWRAEAAIIRDLLDHGAGVEPDHVRLAMLEAMPLSLIRRMYRVAGAVPNDFAPYLPFITRGVAALKPALLQKAQDDGLIEELLVSWYADSHDVRTVVGILSRLKNPSKSALRLAAYAIEALNDMKLLEALVEGGFLPRDVRIPAGKREVTLVEMAAYAERWDMVRYLMEKNSSRPFEPSFLAVFLDKGRFILSKTVVDSWLVKFRGRMPRKFRRTVLSLAKETLDGAIPEARELEALASLAPEIFAKIPYLAFTDEVFASRKLRNLALKAMLKRRPVSWLDLHAQQRTSLFGGPPHMEAPSRRRLSPRWDMVRSYVLEAVEKSPAAPSRWGLGAMVLQDASLSESCISVEDEYDYFDELGTAMKEVAELGCDVCLRSLERIGIRDIRSGDWVEPLPDQEAIEMIRRREEDARLHAAFLKGDWDTAAGDTKGILQGLALALGLDVPPDFLASAPVDADVFGVAMGAGAYLEKSGWEEVVTTRDGKETNVLSAVAGAFFPIGKIPNDMLAFLAGWKGYRLSSPLTLRLSAVSTGLSGVFLEMVRDELRKEAMADSSGWRRILDLLPLATDGQAISILLSTAARARGMSVPMLLGSGPGGHPLYLWLVDVMKQAGPWWGLVLGQFSRAGMDVARPEILRKVVRSRSPQGVRVVLDRARSSAASMASAVLMDAVRFCPECVPVLLSHGAGTSVRDSGGRTPLHVAAQLGRSSVVEALVAAGARVDARDRAGRLAVHYAAARCDTRMYRALVKAGSPVDVRDAAGWTARRLVSLCAR